MEEYSKLFVNFDVVFLENWITLALTGFQSKSVSEVSDASLIESYDFDPVVEPTHSLSILSHFVYIYITLGAVQLMFTALLSFYSTRSSEQTPFQFPRFKRTNKRVFPI